MLLALLAALLAGPRHRKPQPVTTHNTKLMVSLRHMLKGCYGCAKERVRAPRTDRRHSPKCSCLNHRAEVDEDEVVDGQIGDVE